MENQIEGKAKNSGLGIAGFILSILGFMIAFGSEFGLFLALLALIFTIIVLATAKKKNLKKGLAIAGLVIAICSFGVGAANNKSDTATNNNGDTQTAQTTNAPIKTSKPAVKDVYALGETATLNGATITVTNVKKSNGTTYDKPKSGNEYVIVTVQIQNDSNSNISYNVYDYKLQDSNGNIVTQAITTVNSDTSLSSGELAPNGTKSGSIAFEAPKGDNYLTLIYQGSYWSSSQLKFALQ